MRQIKFRAWDTNKKEMLTQVWYESEGQKRTSLEHMYDDDVGYQVDFEDAFCMPELALMQFTGLLDKNGKEIYEGDVVRADGRLWKIVFNHGGFGFQNVNMPVHWLDYMNGIEGEVIGNIYENPDEITK